MDTIQTQQLFFNHIKSRLPPQLALVDEIADVLKISSDSAYRRIRGEKPVSMDEMHVLCNKYQISIDQLFQIQSNTIIFSGNKVDKDSFNFINYLQYMQNSLQLFKKLRNPLIYFFLRDIPIFYYMQFPELCAFKFFFWKRTILNYPELAKRQFNGEETDIESLELVKKNIELYNQVPSTEIWNEQSVHMVIGQIEFYRQSNIFADNFILQKVYAQLEELLNHVERQAELGKKFLYNRPISPNAAQYDMYINEWLLGDNIVFIQSDERQISIINHNILNLITTEDKSFCEYTFKNLQNIISKSTHISLVGEKERSIFFNMLRGKIHDKVRNVH